METTYKYRVLYADTDAMGVVYYGNYLRIYEAARGDFLHKVGMPFSKMASELNIVCPVANAEINYHKPAYLDEDIVVRTRVVMLRGARMVFDQRIFNAKDELLNDIKVTVAFVDMEKRRPVKYPDIFDQVLSVE
ncbi:MAG: acyl-CoA thioesterase [Bacteroidales bacterium]|jgi:acyl-CoA thioester hydrolase|nr:acyl-CoA thioesterase [Bacteroidales bacterium]MBR4585007.1 acyl-CoA thioesterase [Bacteroidales bacterium]